MAERYIDRFFEKYRKNNDGKEILRKHPAFLLAKQELTSQANIIDILRRIRKEKGYTQRQLAERTGISRSYIARLESGAETNPGLKSIEKISNALDRKIVVI